MLAASSVSAIVGHVHPGTGSESSMHGGSVPAESPLLPEKRNRRLGSVAVKDDWKYWSPTVKPSASA